MASAKSLGSGARFRPKRGLGQHFLVDPSVVHTMLARAGLQPSDSVLEIGPGRGALTVPLARMVDRVVAVEKDQLLVAELEKSLEGAGIMNVRLIHGDILHSSFDEFPHAPGSKMTVVGNLPYNISSPVLEMLIARRDLVRRAVLMFQHEVAERLIAPPGVKAYGALTVLVRYYAQASPLLKVRREAFSPRPKVTSMVLELDFERPYPARAADERVFKKVVKGAFAHRRKTLVNSLTSWFSGLAREDCVRGLERCRIDPSRRGETLDLDEFLRLATVLGPEIDN